MIFDKGMYIFWEHLNLTENQKMDTGLEFYVLSDLFLYTVAANC